MPMKWVSITEWSLCPSGCNEQPDHNPPVVSCLAHSFWVLWMPYGLENASGAWTTESNFWSSLARYWILRPQWWYWPELCCLQQSLKSSPCQPWHLIQDSVSNLPPLKGRKSSHELSVQWGTWRNVTSLVIYWEHSGNWNSKIFLPLPAVLESSDKVSEDSDDLYFNCWWFAF